MNVKSEVTTVDLLQLMFIYLKLTGQINWSWYVCMTPWLSCIASVIVIAVISEYNK